MVSEYKRLKERTLKLLEEDWGPRCDMKDTEDFPDLVGKTEVSEGRCPCCLVYERFDNFWELFDIEDASIIS